MRSGRAQLARTTKGEVDMSSSKQLALAGLVMACAASAGCSGTYTANVNINATVNVTTTADANHVHQGTSVPIDITVMGAYLVDANATPPAEHVNDAVHIQIYLDDVNTTPVLITAMTHVDVMVPASTPPGPHHFICRLHRHDGTATNVSFSFSFSVEVGTGGTDAATTDAG
jgi:hypothetical protein